MDVKLILDIDEDHVDEAGYAAHHQVRDLWPAYTKSGVYLEPNTGLAMLEPSYVPRDAVAGEWIPDVGTEIDIFPGLDFDLLRIPKSVVGPTAGVTSRYTLPKGVGHCFLFITIFHFYVGAGHLDVYFGGRYWLRLSNQAEAILYRSPTPTWGSGFVGYDLGDWVKVASGSLLTATSLYYNYFFLQILPLPGGVKVSTSAGEIFYRESDLDPESGQAMLPAPSRLAVTRAATYWTDSPLTFAASGSFASPILALPYSSTQPPSVSYLAHQPLPEGTSVSVSLTKGDGSPPEPPMEDYKYTVTLSTAETTQTPYYWATRAEFVPTQRTATGASITVDSFIREIQERCSLDQPLRSLTFSANDEGGALDSYKRRANLPVQLKVSGVPRFTGATNLPTAEEGHPEWVTLECYDGWRRLQNALLSNGETYDGMVHTEVVKRICQRAGLPESRLEIAFDTYCLPTSQDDEPLYRPENGQSAASFLEHIRDSFSGWRMGFDEEGKLFYRPPASDLTPKAYFYRTTADAEGMGGAPARHYPLFSLSEKVDQSQHRNEIWVVGQDQRTEEPLAAAFLDYSSLYDPTYAYYVGERRLLIWLDPGLNTQDAVNWVCRTLAEKYARFRVYQNFEGQFDETLKPEAVVEVDGETARIISMSSRFTTKEQRTRYEVSLEA